MLHIWLQDERYIEISIYWWLVRGHLPNDVCFQRSQKLICVYLCKDLRLPYDTRICKEDIEATIRFDGIINNSFDCDWIRSVESSGVDVHARIQRCELSFVRCQVGIVEIADIYSLCTVLGELVCRSPANS